MSKLRVVPYRELRKVAEHCGFAWARYEGSHNVFAHPDGRIIVIPNHGSQDTVRPLVRKTVRDLGLSRDESHRLLDE